MLILVIAGLVILGPERLPGAVSWTMRSIRQVRDYATGATENLKNEMGPEFEDLRKPLAELNELRGMTPRSIITKHLLDGDDSFFTGNFDEAPVKPVSSPVPAGSQDAAALADRTPDISQASDGPTHTRTRAPRPAVDSPSDADHKSTVDQWDAT
ncbi:hypothetical protein GCM10011489_00710 [Gordonia jinhuaensis]|uniref:Sec-independent protein translocase protein TatB n=1 Tax=Gordonia jinhuaensis TaxID=1517702 RepID=A0A916SSX4_9ACTN|nr:hypothetical protein GCM10011489_00710 [Gordonia jinhuaensis]